MIRLCRKKLMTSLSLDNVIKLVSFYSIFTKMTTFEVYFVPRRSKYRQNLMRSRVSQKFENLKNISEFVYRLQLYKNNRGWIWCYLKDYFWKLQNLRAFKLQRCEACWAVTLSYACYWYDFMIRLVQKLNIYMLPTKGHAQNWPQIAKMTKYSIFHDFLQLWSNFV